MLDNLSISHNSLRLYSSGGKNDGGNNNNDDPDDVAKSEDSPPVITSAGVPNAGALSSITVPENFPNVPIIAVNRNPVFPRFIKMIEIKDPKLMELLRKKTSLSLPYAGVFVTKDDANESEIVDDIEEIHNVGTFVQ